MRYPVSQVREPRKITVGDQRYFFSLTSL